KHGGGTLVTPRTGLLTRRSATHKGGIDRLSLTGHGMNRMLTDPLRQSRRLPTRVRMVRDIPRVSRSFSSEKSTKRILD
ncbi:MAG: hypothetical protein OXF07_11950, partial [Rhodobacter sp.]|nr:hypothetical protein [Rhodobacter sp.]